MWLMVWDVSFQELASKEINIKTVNNNMYLLKSAVFSDQNSDKDSERSLRQMTNVNYMPRVIHKRRWNILGGEGCLKFRC